MSNAQVLGLDVTLPSDLDDPKQLHLALILAKGADDAYYQQVRFPDDDIRQRVTQAIINAVLEVPDES